MDLDILIQRPVSNDTAYLWNLKKWYKWTYLQKGNRLTGIENKYVATKGEIGGRDKLRILD